MPNKASDTVADCFWEDIICRHGNVATVIPDRGGELPGSFEELLDRCLTTDIHGYWYKILMWTYNFLAI